MQLRKRVRIIQSTPLVDRKVQLKFEDGLDKIVDLSPFLRGPIFAEIRHNDAMFRAIIIEGGTISWENGADIDPDVLYYDLKPAWMESAEKLIA